MKFDVPQHLKKSSGVYKIWSKIDDRVYIGSSTNLLARYNAHHNKLIHQTHPNRLMREFTSKNGVDKLIFSPVLFCKPEELDKNEQFYIDKTFPNGFNLRPYTKDNRGIKGTKESIEKRRRNAGFLAYLERATKLSSQQQTSLIADYTANTIEIKEILSKYDISNTLLWKILNKNNVPRRRPISKGKRADMRKAGEGFTNYETN